MTPSGAMAAGTRRQGLAMASDLPARYPGASMPDTIQDTATRAGRRRRPIDPVVLSECETRWYGYLTAPWVGITFRFPVSA